MLGEFRFMRISLKDEFKRRGGRDFGITFGVQAHGAPLVFYQLFVVFLSPERFFARDLDVVETQDVEYVC